MNFLTGIFEPFLEARGAEFSQVFHRRSVLRGREAHCEVATELQLQLARLGYLHRVFEGFRDVRPVCAHLVRTAQVVRGGFHAKPFGVLHIRVCLDARENVLRLVVVPADVVRIVGDDQRETGLFAQLDDGVIDLGLPRYMFVHHQLEVIAVLEHVSIPLECLVCSIEIARLDVACQLA